LRKAYHGCVDERLAARAKPLLFVTHPLVVIEPGERALHHPAPWQDLNFPL
jgi:hypothetical protein